MRFPAGAIFQSTTARALSSSVVPRLHTIRPRRLIYLQRTIAERTFSYITRDGGEDGGWLFTARHLPSRL